MTKQGALDLIKTTPGCVAMLDNDCWDVQRPKPNNWNEMTEAAQDLWYEEQATLISSRDVDDCDYGGGLVEVLAIEVGMTCEGV